jgi:hypothetical protein
MALHSSVFEDVGLLATDVLNNWHWLEEHVDWCIPIFAQSI